MQQWHQDVIDIGALKAGGNAVEKLNVLRVIFPHFWGNEGVMPRFFLLYRNVITTHISYWFFSEIPPQDRDGVAATVLPPGCLNRKLIEGKFWKVVPKFPPPFRKTLVHLDGFIIPKSLHNTPKCVKWAKNVPLSTAQTNTGYPAFFCSFWFILTICSTYVERKNVAPNPL